MISFKDTTNCIPLPLFILNTRGKILSAHSQAKEKFPENQLKNFLTLFSRSSSYDLKEALREMAEAGTLRTCCTAETKEGNKVYVSMGPADGNGKIAVVLVDNCSFPAEK
ncbi:MAG: hypothetical protein ACQEP5_06400 [Actinomycetota bacterium]